MKTYKYTINGVDYEVTMVDVENGQGIVEVNGVRYKVKKDGAPVPTSKPKVSRPTRPASAPSAEAAPAPSRPKGGAAQGGITSPLPGVILEVKVKEGDMVKAGQPLMILEAMKMENSIEAEQDGRVLSIPVKQGDSVMEGDTLISIGE